MSKSIQPYKSSDKGKREQVELMFNNISKSYDLLNKTLSLGIDRYWRRVTVKTLIKRANIERGGSKLEKLELIDFATGTCDLAIESAKKIDNCTVTGVDISQGMLDIGAKKLKQKGLEDRVKLQRADSTDIPFNSDSFDGYTVGFGVRNYQDLELGLREMHRVLKPNGIAVILEFSKPRAFPIKQLYTLYSDYFLPLWGRIISKDYSAYSYLPESVKNFPDGDDFSKIMRDSGYRNIEQRRLTFGIVTVYSGVK